MAAHIAQLNSEGHVLLAGDLDARVGAASQPWITELGEGISAQLQNRDITVNGHGRKLMRLCEEAAMVLCTGRTPGDTPAQPSFRARSNTEPSRLDHVLVDCGLFPAVQSSRVGAHRHESDHFPLELQLLLTVPTLPTAPPPPGCGTAASGGPMHMPSCQGRARPLLLASQLQPLLISTACQRLAVPI